MGKLYFYRNNKKIRYLEDYINFYFWRTWDGKEIDMIEEKDGKLIGYEFKYSEKKIKKIKDWEDNYKSNIILINKDNFLDFIT